MICPWLKRRKKFIDRYGYEITEESYQDCEGYECPFYVGEQRCDDLIVSEHCRRVTNASRCD